MATKTTESDLSVEKEGDHQSTSREMTGNTLKHPCTPDALLTDESEALARKAFLKFDLILVLPILTVFYLLSIIDRVNIGNARVAGLQTDLKMTDHQFSLALTITYIPYLAVEIPASLVLKRVGANILLPTIAMVWGLITALQGIVSSYQGLLVARFFLGLVEGGLLPGITLIMSRFYKRDQIQLRITLLFSASSLAGAFSGLLASAILGIDRGHRGWQWLFIIEGVFTVAFGLLSFFFLPRTPTSSQFLTEKEKRAVHLSLEQDWTPDSEEEAFSWSQVIAAFTTPHVLILGIISFLGGNILFGLSYFAPTIIRGMGYSPLRTQLMSVPPYAATFVASVGIAILSDRWRERGYSLLFSGIIAMTGYIIFLASTDTPVLYGSIFLQTIGAFTAAPAGTTWNVNNVQPHYKRSAAVGLVTSMASFGGILSTWIFDDPPRFRKATRINLASSIGICVLAVVNRVWLMMQNKRKAEERARRQPLGSKEEEEEEKRRLGDDHPDFIYTL